MIVLKSFILRENLKKYNAGDNFPRESVSPARIAELVQKGKLKPESETHAADDMAEIDNGAKPAKSTTSRKPRTKKG